MNKYYIGIMTGTSADAIDGCVVSFDGNFNLIGLVLKSLLFGNVYYMLNQAISFLSDF